MHTIMINESSYKKILHEYFDMGDNETYQIMNTINENDQKNVLHNLTDKLYDYIIGKIDDIDFGTIPNSKGDITKIQNYDQMIDCLDIIKKYLIQYKESTETVDNILDAIMYLKNDRDILTKGFTFKVEPIILSYCTICLSIVASVSLLITSTIEYIKDPNSTNYKIVVDKTGLVKTKEFVSYKNILSFNSICRSGDFTKAMTYSLANKEEHFLGTLSMIAGGAGLAAIILNIVPIIRELIFFFYSFRVKASDYFETQSTLLKMNAYNLSTGSSSDKNIGKKQMDIANKFKDMSNFFAINNKKAAIYASKEESKIAKKYKVSDLVSSKPDSAQVSLF